LQQSITKLAVAGIALAIALWLCHQPVVPWLSTWQGPRDLAALAIIALIGATVYGGIVLVLFGRDWVSVIRTKPRR